MDRVFQNYHRVYNYFSPKSYLDIGACKGHHIPYVLQILKDLNKIELIEACRYHEYDLKLLQNSFFTKNISYKIEVLSDCVKEVDFYLSGLEEQGSGGTGNSYYKEDTPHYVNCVIEKRITNTLDILYKYEEPFDLIKMDTQGSELDIIKGGLNIISNAKGIILEENVVTFNTGAPLHYEVKPYMESIGFVLCEILDEKNYPINNSKGVLTPHHEIDTLYIRKDVLNL